MSVPLYQLPGPEEENYKYVRPDPHGYDGRSYAPPWSALSLFEKIMTMLVPVVFFAIALGLPYLAWLNTPR